MPVSNNLIRFTIILFILVNATAGYGQNNLQSRPKVGLVLSGGAAKGIAHIGVLKVIEKTGLPIDLIGGTSMGAIVGGLYASGYDANELEQVVKKNDWEKLLCKKQTGMQSLFHLTCNTISGKTIISSGNQTWV